MGSIVIPARAGILSAQGMVFADPVLDSMQALFLRGEELDSPVLSEAMDTLVAKGLAEFRGVPGHAFVGRVVDAEGRSVPLGGGGYLVLKRPWPGMLRAGRRA